MTTVPLAPTLPAGKFRGVFLGTVEDNKDDPPNNPGFRIRVTIDTLVSGIRTFWARVVVPMGGNERGTYFLPQKGEQVLVVFEHGNMNRTPIVLGTLWNSKHEPPEVNKSGDNNTKLIRTPKGHRIIFDDKDSAEKLIVVDRTGNNKIEIDSAAKKVTIQSDGDLEIIARKDAIFHAKTLKLNSKGDLIQKAKNVGLHAMGSMSLFGPGKVTGAIQINMNPTPACTIVPAPLGSLGGGAAASDSETAAKEAQQQRTAVAAKPQVEQGAQSLNEQEMKAREANGPGLSDVAAGVVGVSAGGLLLAGMVGGAALNDGGFGNFGGGLGGAAGLGGGLSGGGSGGASNVGDAGGASAAGSPSAFAGDESVAAADPTSGSDRPEANRLSTGAAGSEDPQWRTGKSSGGVGHDVKGRASASANVSASGVDVFTSSSSSVFQESAVSRATNPAQVPDAAVRVVSEADQLATAADPAQEASSHIRPLPLEPTPPVVEPRSAAAAAAPDSVRSAVDTAADAERSTSDVRAYMKDPEQGGESAARSVVNERISAAHPMGAKGEVNAQVSTYGDPNMFAKAKVDHQVDRAEAAQKVAVADEHFSADASVSTEGDGDAPKATKLPVEFENLDPKQPDPKKPGSKSDPKKPGAK